MRAAGAATGQAAGARRELQRARQRARIAVVLAAVVMVVAVLGVMLSVVSLAHADEPRPTPASQCHATPTPEPPLAVTVAGSEARNDPLVPRVLLVAGGLLVFGVTGKVLERRRARRRRW